MTWSARQYSQFEVERTRPVRDLVAAIPRDRARTVVDLGCGPGNSTEVLIARYPDAQAEGIDSDEDMLAAARARLPHTRFSRADIATWVASDRVDVILANASLQWLPDHAALYPRLLTQLNEGGCLAIQTPDNLAEPAHRLARELAATAPFAAHIGAVRHPDRHEPRWYHALLAPLGAQVDVWRTTYFHALADHRAVVEWFKGSALRPFLSGLDEELEVAFLERYLAAITDAYPSQPDGSVLLPFPRLFIVALR